MAKTPAPQPAPQQQGDTHKPGGQMTGNTGSKPQQGEPPVIRDWASI